MTIRNRMRAFMALIVSCLAVNFNANAQNFVKLVNDSDIVTKKAYSDSLLTKVSFPHAVTSLPNYPKVNIAAIELMQILEDPDIELFQVYVKGSASPEGLWGDNIKISQKRADNLAHYIQYALDVPKDKIRVESVVEDWDKLYELVEKSDIPYKYEVLDIIKYLNWGERKQALMKLGGGKVWKILLKDFFPELRYAKFGIYCRVKPEPQMHRPDTVYVRDTVYIREIIREQVSLQPIESHEFKTDQMKKVGGEMQKVETKQDISSEEIVTEDSATPQDVSKDEEDTVKKVKKDRKPWRMGIGTNLLSDAAVVPNLGLEFQLSKHFSLKVNGWYTNYNVVVPSDNETNIYGFRPQLRYWFGNKMMGKGSYIAADGAVMWYTLQWKDGLLYQNGKENVWNQDAGNNSPAWNVGLTYGYSLGFGETKNWGIEFEAGIGYGSFSQNVGRFNEISGKWEFAEYQPKQTFGITHASVTLTYRFSTK